MLPEEIPESSLEAVPGPLRSGEPPALFRSAAQFGLLPEAAVAQPGAPLPDSQEAPPRREFLPWFPFWPLASQRTGGKTDYCGAACARLHPAFFPKLSSPERPSSPATLPPEVVCL